MTREHVYAIADVFTDTPLQGNALAVFLDASGLETEMMQRTARELNLSETAFLLPDEEDARLDAQVRIFTPTAELPFAGHPVLGTAVVLSERTGRRDVLLRTGAGIIPVAVHRGAGAAVYGEMDQPIPRPERFDGADELLAALGTGTGTGPGPDPDSNARVVAAYRNGPFFVYVEVESEEHLTALRPDMNALSGLGELGVSCFTGDPPRVLTRMFAPALGVPEDPATGSAAGPLAVHLVRSGRLGHGQPVQILQGEQTGRPSVIDARIEGEGEQIERVVVGGSTVIVARGAYRLT